MTTSKNGQVQHNNPEAYLKNLLSPTKFPLLEKPSHEKNYCA
jgi:hypothetical protein